MDTLSWLSALLLGLVEGLTEFLPVSSTGHLIVASELMGLRGEKMEVFNIFIQAGAILAVCWEYRAKLIATFAGILSDAVAQRFVINICVAFFPFAVLGFTFKKLGITTLLFKPLPVALAFIIGGIVILIAERWYTKRTTRTDARMIDSVDDLTWKDALKLGLAQCAALIPGTSRSAATIIGGLFFGLTRKCATEFSFFLAIPTLMGATVYALWSSRHILSTADVPLFSVGFVAAFVSAFVVVRWLIRFVSTHDFSVFAWYRMVFGVVIIATAQMGLVRWA